MILDPADILPNIPLFIVTIARLLHLLSVKYCLRVFTPRSTRGIYTAKPISDSSGDPWR